MIDEQLTFEKFGYRGIDLSKGSHKKIMAICSICGKVREVYKFAYTEICKTCSSRKTGLAHKGKPSPTRGKSWHWKKTILKPKRVKRVVEPKIYTRHTLESVKAITTKLKGRKFSEQHLLHLKEAHLKLRGQNSSHWKGGISPLRDLIYQLQEYHNWRTTIFIRDDSKCRECGEQGQEVHHIKRFARIYEEFLKEYDQFSPMEDKETLLRLATKYKPFWDVTNGKTLCSDCHSKTKGRV